MSPEKWVGRGGPQSHLPLFLESINRFSWVFPSLLGSLSSCVSRVALRSALTPVPSPLAVGVSPRRPGRGSWSSSEGVFLCVATPSRV